MYIYIYIYVYSYIYICIDTHHSLRLTLQNSSPLMLAFEDGGEALEIHIRNSLGFLDPLH